MSPLLPRHVSVLPAEVLALLAPAVGEVWVDATTGVGGHCRLLAEAVGPAGRVIGLDQDPAMLEIARGQLEGLPVTLVHANFEQLANVLRDLGIPTVDGVLADLGFCSDQMEDASRGLSFQQDGPLDMRLDTSLGEPAKALIHRLQERELADLFWHYGEERHSRRVAKRIVEQRRLRRFETTSEFAELVRRCVPRDGRIDPATRVFQALRIAVNDELGALERLLAVLPRVVKPGGRVGVISFHSLEDRLVKRAFQDGTVWQKLNKKPLQASELQMQSNPRSRSAKLRTARRLTPP